LQIVSCKSRIRRSNSKKKSNSNRKILVEGEKLTITYTNDEVKESKKEAGSSLTDTLANYDVPKEALAGRGILLIPYVGSVLKPILS
jgi:hypothetical protein